MTREIGGDQGTEDTRAPGKEKERRIKGGREQQKQESSSKGMGAAMRNRKKKNRDRAKFVVGKPRPQQEIREIRQETHQLEVAEQTTHEEDGELMAGQNEEVEEEEDGEEEWMCPPSDDIAEVEGSSQPQSGRPSSHVLTSPRSSDYNFDHRSASSSRGQSSHRLSSLTEATPPCPTPASLQPSTPSLAALTSERRTPKPVKSETSSVSCHMTSRRSDQQRAEVNKSEDATRQRELRAEKAEHRRQEVERRRREKEEERLRQQEKEEREERVQEELQEERKQRAEQASRAGAPAGEEQQRREEELRRLVEMEEDERTEYLLRLQEEDERRRTEEEERRRRQEDALRMAREEARLQMERFSREKVALEQRLRFRRGLLLEAGGLEQSQDVSRLGLL
ncbi:trichohyalin-like, partial [Denticeps clupeoides]|uniref:trichohyalin-like n=1 Tax=Denticeps clupeoides TaxID=299321 RepID=UPI0010A43C85